MFPKQLNFIDELMIYANSKILVFVEQEKKSLCDSLQHLNLNEFLDFKILIVFFRASCV
jgi:hypothetical protein